MNRLRHYSETWSTKNIHPRWERLNIELGNTLMKLLQDAAVEVPDVVVMGEEDEADERAGAEVEASQGKPVPTVA
jgi:cell envelope opacity-associated protein A